LNKRRDGIGWRQYVGRPTRLRNPPAWREQDRERSTAEAWLLTQPELPIGKTELRGRIWCVGVRRSQRHADVPGASRTNEAWLLVVTLHRG
jgi:hypothetical protein